MGRHRRRPRRNDTFIVFWNRGTTDLRRTTLAAAGSWSTTGTHSLAALLSSFTGLAADVDSSGNYQLVVTGSRATSGDAVVATAQLTSAFSLGTWYPVSEADNSSGIFWMRSPSIVVFNDTAMVTFLEREDDPVPYTRSYFAIGQTGLSAAGYFSEPQPLEALTSHGACLTAYPGDPAHWFYTTSDGVWSAYYDDADDELADVVVSLKARLSQDSASLSVVLQNADKSIDIASPAAIGSGTLAVGSTLALNAGYVGSAGAEYGSTWTFEVTRIRWKLTPKGYLVTVDAAGIWERARQMRSRQSVYTAGATGSRSAYFARALARVGGARVRSAGSPNAPGADWTTDHSPDFSASPGQRWSDVAERFLRFAPEGLYYDGTDIYVRSVSTSDAAAVTYSNTTMSYPVTELELIEEAPAVNWSRVSSDDRYTDGYLYGHIARHGPRLEQLFEPDADSNTKAIEVANGAIARHRWGDRRGIARTPWHPGIQLLDVVNVADSRIGLAAADYRVLAHAIDYERSPRARFDQLLELGAL